MGIHREPAEVLVDGERYPCQADLFDGVEKRRDPLGGPPIEGLPWWRGTIELNDVRTALTVEAVEYGVLEANGREATFRVTGRLGRKPRIESNGSLAPFD